MEIPGPAHDREDLFGRSSFDIAVGMFFKRKLAILGAAVVLLMYLAAIWAPLLATNLPIRFRGTDRGTAERSARVARLETLSLVRAFAGEEGRTRSQVDHSFEVVDDQFRMYLENLKGPPAERARGLRERVAALRPTPPGRGAGEEPAAADPGAAASLKALAGEMGEALAFDDGDLRTRTRWPAIRVLDGLDVALLVLSISGFAAIPFLRRRPGRPRRPRKAFQVALLPAVAAGFLWAAAVDTFQDPTDYKGGLATGALAAESVTWAPVPYGLNENDLARVVQGPSPDHLLGTDESGRDMLCRLLWGARVSLSVGFVAVGIYVLIGVVVGALAGYFRGWVDIVFSRILEVFLCFPTFFLILVIAAFLADRTIMGMDPPRLVVIMVIIGITGWPFVARLVRAEFLKLVAQDFVVAARALGSVDRGVIFRHVMPNALAPVLVAATFGVAGAILLESALSFLGLGITVPRPSWGGMLFSARGYEQKSTWIFLWPGLAIFLVITCYNLVGEALRDAMDPRLRQ